MNTYWDIYQTVIMIDAVCKVCVGVLSARLIIFINRLVKAAYQERNQWEPVEQEEENECKKD